MQLVGCRAFPIYIHTNKGNLGSVGGNGQLWYAPKWRGALLFIQVARRNFRNVVSLVHTLLVILIDLPKDMWHL